MYRKKTAAFNAAYDVASISSSRSIHDCDQIHTGLLVETSPVTQARHIDIAVALTIIRTLLPNLSTVKAQIMPPRMMQAFEHIAQVRML